MKIICYQLSAHQLYNSSPMTLLTSYTEEDLMEIQPFDVQVMSILLYYLGLLIPTIGTKNLKCCPRTYHVELVKLIIIY